MKIKVGEYVRTKKGKIFKYGKGRAYIGKDNEIVSHSFNIKELIEEGDYINGEKVDSIEKTSLENGYKRIIYCNECEGLFSQIIINDEDIKTILTKEQFERDCYVVKEKK